MNNPIKMEVGIEDCLHIEFEYNKTKSVGLNRESARVVLMSLTNSVLRQYQVPLERCCHRQDLFSAGTH